MRPGRSPPSGSPPPIPACANAASSKLTTITRKPPRLRTLKVLQAGGIDPDLAINGRDRETPGPEGHANVIAVASPKLAVPAFIRYRDKTENERMANVPKRIPELVADYFGFSLMPFHKEILKRLFAGGMHDIILPTEHGKSSICDVVFPILSLMNDPNGAHIVCCTNLNDAKRWLAVVERHLTTNTELLRDYPWLEKPKSIQGRLWSKTALTIAGRSDRNNSNPSLIAIGQGSGDIRGRRGKFIADDLEGVEAWSETERRALWDWMMLEAMRSYEDIARTPRPLFANIGTPYDVDSIHFKLIETGEFQLFRQPYKYETGRLIWPAKKDKIAKLRHTWDDRQFAIAMELNPKGDDESVLSAAEIMALGHATENKLAVETATFVSLDPASGSRKRRADYAGLAVCRIEWTAGEPLPRVEVLEAFKIRDEAIYQVQEAAALARRYSCPVVCEVNAMQRTYKGLFQHFAGDVRVIQHYTTARNKQDNQMGLTVLKTLLRNGRLKMVSPDGQSRQSDGMKALVRELRDLGTGAHDHISAAIWFAVFYMFQRVRNRSLPKVTTMRKPQLSPYAGFGSSRLTTTIDLRRFRTG